MNAVSCLQLTGCCPIIIPCAMPISLPAAANPWHIAASNMLKQGMELLEKQHSKFDSTCRGHAPHTPPCRKPSESLSAQRPQPSRHRLALHAAPRSTHIHARRRHALRCLNDPASDLHEFMAKKGSRSTRGRKPGSRGGSRAAAGGAASAMSATHRDAPPAASTRAATSGPAMPHAGDDDVSTAEFSDGGRTVITVGPREPSEKLHSLLAWLQEGLTNLKRALLDKVSGDPQKHLQVQAAMRLPKSLLASIAKKIAAAHYLNTSEVMHDLCVTCAHTVVLHVHPVKKWALQHVPRYMQELHKHWKRGYMPKASNDEQLLAQPLLPAEAQRMTISSDEAPRVVPSPAVTQCITQSEWDELKRRGVTAEHLAVLFDDSDAEHDPRAANWAVLSCATLPAPVPGIEDLPADEAEGGGLASEHDEDGTVRALLAWAGPRQQAGCCGVACALCKDPRTWDDDPLVACGGCGLLVHRLCGGVADSDLNALMQPVRDLVARGGSADQLGPGGASAAQDMPMRLWLCSTCKHGLEPGAVPCALCPWPGAGVAGPMSPLVAEECEWLSTAWQQAHPAGSFSNELWASGVGPAGDERRARAAAAAGQSSAQAAARAQAVGIPALQRPDAASSALQAVPGTHAVVEVLDSAWRTLPLEELQAHVRQASPWFAEPGMASHFVHTLCAMYCIGPRMNDIETLGPVTNLSGVSARRWGTQCWICGQACGVVVRCAAAGCHSGAHATCAATAGARMRFEWLMPGHPELGGRLSAYCIKHDPRPDAELAANVADALELRQAQADGTWQPRGLAHTAPRSTKARAQTKLARTRTLARHAETSASKQRRSQLRLRQRRVEVLSFLKKLRRLQDRQAAIAEAQSPAVPGQVETPGPRAPSSGTSAAKRSAWLKVAGRPATRWWRAHSAPWQSAPSCLLDEDSAPGAIVPEPLLPAPQLDMAAEETGSSSDSGDSDASRPEYRDQYGQPLAHGFVECGDDSTDSDWDGDVHDLWAYTTQAVAQAVETHTRRDLSEEAFDHAARRQAARQAEMTAMRSEDREAIAGRAHGICLRARHACELWCSALPWFTAVGAGSVMLSARRLLPARDWMRPALALQDVPCSAQDVPVYAPTLTRVAGQADPVHAQWTSSWEGVMGVLKVECTMVDLALQLLTRGDMEEAEITGVPVAPASSSELADLASSWLWQDARDVKCDNISLKPSEINVKLPWGCPSGTRVAQHDKAWCLRECTKPLHTEGALTYAGQELTQDSKARKRAARQTSSARTAADKLLAKLAKLKGQPLPAPRRERKAKPPPQPDAGSADAGSADSLDGPLAPPHVLARFFAEQSYRAAEAFLRRSSSQQRKAWLQRTAEAGTLAAPMLVTLSSTRRDIPGKAAWHTGVRLEVVPKKKPGAARGLTGELLAETLVELVGFRRVARMPADHRSWDGPVLPGPLADIAGDPIFQMPDRGERPEPETSRRAASGSAAATAASTPVATPGQRRRRAAMTLAESSVGSASESEASETPAPGKKRSRMVARLALDKPARFGGGVGQTISKADARKLALLKHVRASDPASAWFIGWNYGEDFCATRHCVPRRWGQAMDDFCRVMVRENAQLQDVRFRFARTGGSDAAMLYAINRVNEAYLTPDSFESALDNHNDFILLAEYKGHVVGFVHFYFMWYQPVFVPEAGRPPPQRVSYVATLQAVRPNTHADLMHVDAPAGTPMPTPADIAARVWSTSTAAEAEAGRPGPRPARTGAKPKPVLDQAWRTGDGPHPTSLQSEACSSSPQLNPGAPPRTGWALWMLACQFSRVHHVNTMMCDSTPEAIPFYSRVIGMRSPLYPERQKLEDTAEAMLATKAGLAGSHAGTKNSGAGAAGTALSEDDDDSGESDATPRRGVNRKRGRGGRVGSSARGRGRAASSASLRIDLPPGEGEEAGLTPATTSATPARKPVRYRYIPLVVDVDLSWSGWAKFLDGKHGRATVRGSDGRALPAKFIAWHRVSDEIWPDDEIMDQLLAVQDELYFTLQQNNARLVGVAALIGEHKHCLAATAKQRYTLRKAWRVRKRRARIAALQREHSMRLAEEDLDAVCAVCNGGKSGPGNQIIFCESCNLAVHQQCFGVDSVPDVDWYCDVCSAAGGKPAAAAGHTPLHVPCAVCGRDRGAFKEVDDESMLAEIRAAGLDVPAHGSGKVWVHSLCCQVLALVDGPLARLRAIAHARQHGLPDLAPCVLQDSPSALDAPFGSGPAWDVSGAVTLRLRLQPGMGPVTGLLLGGADGWLAQRCGSSMCSACHQGGGLMIPCSVPWCDHMVHPVCAVRYGLVTIGAQAQADLDSLTQLEQRHHSAAEQAGDGPEQAPGAEPSMPTFVSTSAPPGEAELWACLRSAASETSGPVLAELRKHQVKLPEGLLWAEQDGCTPTAAQAKDLVARALKGQGIQVCCYCAGCRPGKGEDLDSTQKLRASPSLNLEMRRARMTQDKEFERLWATHLQSGAGGDGGITQRRVLSKYPLLQAALGPVSRWGGPAHADAAMDGAQLLQLLADQPVIAGGELVNAGDSEDEDGVPALAAATPAGSADHVDAALRRFLGGLPLHVLPKAARARAPTQLMSAAKLLVASASRGHMVLAGKATKKSAGSAGAAKPADNPARVQSTEGDDADAAASLPHAAVKAEQVQLPGSAVATVFSLSVSRFAEQVIHALAKSEPVVDVPGVGQLGLPVQIQSMADMPVSGVFGGADYVHVHTGAVADLCQVLAGERGAVNVGSWPPQDAVTQRCKSRRAITWPAQLAAVIASFRALPTTPATAVFTNIFAHVQQLRNAGGKDLAVLAGERVCPAPGGVMSKAMFGRSAEEFLGVDCLGYDHRMPLFADESDRAKRWLSPAGVQPPPNLLNPKHKDVPASYLVDGASAWLLTHPWLWLQERVAGQDVAAFAGECLNLASLSQALARHAATCPPSQQAWMDSIAAARNVGRTVTMSEFKAAGGVVPEEKPAPALPPPPPAAPKPAGAAETPAAAAASAAGTAATTSAEPSVTGENGEPAPATPAKPVKTKAKAKSKTAAAAATSASSAGAGDGKPPKAGEKRKARKKSSVSAPADSDRYNVSAAELSHEHDSAMVFCDACKEWFELNTLQLVPVPGTTLCMNTMSGVATNLDALQVFLCPCCEPVFAPGRQLFTNPTYNSPDVLLGWLCEHGIPEHAGRQYFGTRVPGPELTALSSAMQDVSLVPPAARLEAARWWLSNWVHRRIQLQIPPGFDAQQVYAVVLAAAQAVQAFPAVAQLLVYGPQGMPWPAPAAVGLEARREAMLGAPYEAFHRARMPVWEQPAAPSRQMLMSEYMVARG